jgi:hypothetical protein
MTLFAVKCLFFTKLYCIQIFYEETGVTSGFLTRFLSTVDRRLQYCLSDVTPKHEISLMNTRIPASTAHEQASPAVCLKFTVPEHFLTDFTAD